MFNFKDAMLKAIPVAMAVSLAGITLSDGTEAQAQTKCGDQSVGSLIGQVPQNPGGSILGTPCDTDLVERSAAFDKAPSVQPGPWQITDDAARGYNTTPERFGTTVVKAVPGKLEFDVRDNMYPLPGGMGTQLVATKDHGQITLPNGDTIPGHQPADDFLRQAQGLDADDPIFALAAFTHFEHSSGSYKELGGPMVKTEMGQTHLAAYMGLGETTNSPDDYHNSVWGNKGYPASVMTVSADMNGDGVQDSTDAKILNRNAHNTLGILGHGVKFPGDYKNDPLTHAKSLKTSLEFYRDWLRDPDDPAFKERINKLYCAELQTISLNLALNVPHNEDAFVELFGSEGKELFELAGQRYAERRGSSPFPELFETDFEPLYKRTEGFSVPSGTAVIDAPDAAIPGNALAWKPQTTADIMKDFIGTYASLPEVGGPISASMVAGFKDLIQQRTGVSTEDYMGLALPVMQKIIVADAIATVSDPAKFEEYLQTTVGTLYVALGGDAASLQSGNGIDPQKMGLAKQIVLGEGLPAQLAGLSAKANAAAILDCAAKLRARIPGDSNEEIYARRLQGHSWMVQSIEDDVARGQAMKVIESGAATYFSAPAVPAKIVLGMWDSHPGVTITGVFTAMDASELKYEEGKEYSIPNVFGSDSPTQQDTGQTGTAPTGDPNAQPDPVTPPVEETGGKGNERADASSGETSKG